MIGIAHVHRQRIAKNRDALFKGYTVLFEVCLCLMFIPFEAVAIPHSTSRVNAGRRPVNRRGIPSSLRRRGG